MMIKDSLKEGKNTLHQLSLVYHPNILSGWSLYEDWNYWCW